MKKVTYGLGVAVGLASTIGAVAPLTATAATIQPQRVKAKVVSRTPDKINAADTSCVGSIERDFSGAGDADYTFWYAYQSVYEYDVCIGTVEGYLGNTAKEVNGFRTKIWVNGILESSYVAGVDFHSASNGTPSYWYTGSHVFRKYFDAPTEVCTAWLWDGTPAYAPACDTVE